MFFMELALGQMLTIGGLGVFKIAPIFKGITSIIQIHSSPLILESFRFIHMNCCERTFTWSFVLKSLTSGTGGIKMGLESEYGVRNTAKLPNV